MQKRQRAVEGKLTEEERVAFTRKIRQNAAEWKWCGQEQKEVFQRNLLDVPKADPDSSVTVTAKYVLSPCLDLTTEEVAILFNANMIGWEGGNMFAKVDGQRVMVAATWDQDFSIE